MKKSETRKGFIKGILALAAGTAVTGWFVWRKKHEEEKVSLMLPNGKMVEMTRSEVDKAKKGKRASNQEVMAWMEARSEENNRTDN